MKVGILLAVGEPFRERDPDDILALVSAGLNGILTATHNRNEVEKAVRSLVEGGIQQVSSDGGPEGWSFTENSGAHVRLLIGVPLATLKDAIFDLLASMEIDEKHILYAGCTAEGSGNWLMKDAALTADAFLQILNRAAIGLTAAGKSLALSLYWKETGPWSLSNLSKAAPGVDLCRGIIISGEESGGMRGVRSLVQSVLLSPQMDPTKMLTPSHAVGKIRFPRPTVYVFPAGEGTCALFGMTSFSLLLEGGFGKKTSAWNLIRHLDGVDLLLVPHFSSETINPVTSLLARQRVSPSDTFPQLGCLFANTPPRVMEKAVRDDPLVISAFDGVEFLSRDLSDLQMKPRPLLVTMKPSKKPNEAVLEPIPLYHKVGHGKLLMYVLNPTKESNEYKALQEGWKKRDVMGVSQKKNGGPPLTTLSSAAVIIVWVPENPLEPPVRFLYPGQAPQQRILASLDKIKSLDFMKTPFRAGPNACSKPVTVPDNTTASGTSSLAPTPVSGAPSPSPLSHDSSNISGLHLHSLTEGEKRTDAGFPSENLEDSTFLCGASDVPLVQHLSPVGPSDHDDLFGPAVSGSIDQLQRDDMRSPQRDEQIFDGNMEPEKFLQGDRENPVPSPSQHSVAFAPLPPSISGEQQKSSARHQTSNHQYPEENVAPPGDEVSMEELKKELGRPLGLPMPTAPRPPTATSTRNGTRRPAARGGAAVESTSSRGTSGASTMADRRGVDPASRRKLPGTGRSLAPTPPEPSPRGSGGARGGRLAEKPARGPPPPAKSAGTAGRKVGPQPTQKPALSAPVYVDMAYIPSDAKEDFFKLVRSRNYVLSGVDPGAEVLSAFLKGKKSWGKSNLEVELIPVYDSASLHLWMALNRDELERESIQVAPSAARCTVSLENDLGTCAAFRMELG